MSPAPCILLNDGRPIPQLGLGVLFMPNEAARDAVQTALQAGYRLIDTASVYVNEAGVGEGMRRSGLAREDIVLTTKLFNHEQGYDEALRACERSLKRLGTDYLDLYLIHWPAPPLGRYVDAWRALVRLREEGRARSIGVSNFQPEHLRRIIDATGVVPAVNQIELHPRWQQRALCEVHGALGIATEAWSPLAQGRAFDDAATARIAAKYGKTEAQVILRWHIQSGVIAIPKSTNPGRIRENLDLFDFVLDADDMAAFAGLDDPAGTIGPDPNTFLGRGGTEAMVKAYGEEAG